MAWKNALVSERYAGVRRSSTAREPFHQVGEPQSMAEMAVVEATCCIAVGDRSLTRAMALRWATDCYSLEAAGWTCLEKESS